MEKQKAKRNKYKELKKEDLFEKIYNAWSNMKSRCWSLEKAITTEKKTKKLLTYKGQTHSISEWEKITGLGRNLRKRLWRGWTIKEALTIPKNENRASKKEGK